MVLEHQPPPHEEPEQSTTFGAAIERQDGQDRTSDIPAITTSYGEAEAEPLSSGGTITAENIHVHDVGASPNINASFEDYDSGHPSPRSMIDGADITNNHPTTQIPAITTSFPSPEQDAGGHHTYEPFSGTTYRNSPHGKGDYGLVHDSPDADTRSLLSNAKVYDHHASRKFLFKTGFARLGVTVGFCLLICLTLKSYEGFGGNRILSNNENRFFNAIMLGLSLGLGLNLASSLKRYAVILRWSILSKRWVDLEVFDLILGCETLTKVGKLMIISIPGIDRVPVLGKWPWFREARKDGTKWTWVICMIWLIVNIGAQVLVATLSLFWPVDPSDAIPLLTRGDITMSDLSQWTFNTPEMPTTNASQLAYANSYGLEGSEYTIAPVGSDPLEQINSGQSIRNTIYVGDGYYEYKFINRNPDRPYAYYYTSERSVQASASCTPLVLDSNDLYYLDDEYYYANASADGGNTWQLHSVPMWVYGSISWVGARPAYCGDRCTNLTVYQYADDDYITSSSLFTCTSTISAVTGGEKQLNVPDDYKTSVWSTDEFARIAAGAIAWTGYTMDGHHESQTRVYLSGLDWSPYEIVAADDVEDLISRFAISSIAAYDDHGQFIQLPNQPSHPVQGQQLSVDWGWIIGLLVAICVIQGLALIALISFANKSIIRDESFFSLAMLLSPVVNKIGKEGMMLSGEEIKNHPKLRRKRIRYDYREGDVEKGVPNQVDIFFQGKDPWDSRRSWGDGWYS